MYPLPVSDNSLALRERENKNSHRQCVSGRTQRGCRERCRGYRRSMLFQFSFDLRVSFKRYWFMTQISGSEAEEERQNAMDEFMEVQRCWSLISSILIQLSMPFLNEKRQTAILIRFRKDAEPCLSPVEDLTDQFTFHSM